MYSDRVNNVVCIIEHLRTLNKNIRKHNLCIFTDLGEVPPSVFDDQLSNLAISTICILYIHIHQRFLRVFRTEYIGSRLRRINVVIICLPYN